MDEEVKVGGGQEYTYRHWTDEELLGPLPAPPQFETSPEAVREHVTKIIGKVPIPREVRLWHPALLRLLNEDQKRREKQRTSSYPSLYDKPKLEAPAALRRLRILNSLFFALGKFNGKPTPDSDAAKSRVSFYSQHVWIQFGSPKKRRWAGGSVPGGAKEEMALSISDSYNSEEEAASWSDGEGSKIESQLSEIAIEIVCMTEQNYRKGLGCIDIYGKG
jgi:hypothetical protein